MTYWVEQKKDREEEDDKDSVDRFSEMVHGGVYGGDDKDEDKDKDDQK